MQADFDTALCGIGGTCAGAAVELPVAGAPAKVAARNDIAEFDAGVLLKPQSNSTTREFSPMFGIVSKISYAPLWLKYGLIQTFSYATNTLPRTQELSQ